MADTLAEMMVSFAVDLNSLNSIPATTSEIFNSMAADAVAASEEISASLDTTGQAANSFAEMSQMAAENAASAFEASASQIDEQLSTIPAAAEESAAKSKESFSGFSLGGMIGQVGMGVFAFQGLTSMAGNLASGLLQPAMNAENMQEAFTNLTGSSQAASDELSKLDTFAAKTQFTTMDIDQAGAQMLGFGFKASSIIPTIQAVGDNLSAVGKGTPAEVQQVVDIFGKMSTQGKITAMDINQLGAHGITAMADIAAGSGKSTTEIQKMIKDGTLPAKDAIADLTSGIEKNPIYAGGMAKQSGTLSGIMSTLSSDWDVFMSKIMSPALPLLEQGLTNLTNLLANPNFQKFATLVGTTLVNGIKTLATDIGNLVTTGQNLVNFFKNNQTAMDALVAVLLTGAGIIAGILIPAIVGWAIAMLPVMIETLATAAPFILLGVIVAAVIFGIIEAVQHWSQITAAVGSFFQMIWGHVVQFFQDDVQKPFQNVINAIGNAFSGFGTMMHNIWNGIGNIIKGAINGIISGINGFIGFIDGIQIHIPSIGVGPVHTPQFDWNGLGIPKIPLLATGGIVPPGSMAIAGDPGPYAELVFGGTAGASVLSHSQSMAAMSGAQQPVEVHNHVYIDGREISNQVMMQVLSQIRSSGHPVGMVA